MAEIPKFDMRVSDLASRIYAGLVRDAVARPEGVAKAPTEAELLAKLSFRFSASFYRVQDALNAENQPKNVGFTVQLDDIAEWSKPAGKP